MSDTTLSPIVELRQYTLHAGTRHVLVELFDREFVESQEAVGIKVIGQFQPLDDPDRFVWLRGFPDMATRARALEAFYDGPVWAQHRDVANATMVDSDNVLLLRPANPGSGFVLHRDRPPPGTARIPAGLVVATIYYLEPSSADQFPDFFDTALVPALRSAGASILAVFVTEPAPNNFPRLPVREGVRVLVYFAAFADEAAHERHRATLEDTPRWRRLERELSRHLTGNAETLRLRPTPRSHCTAEAGEIVRRSGATRCRRRTHDPP
jgi:hypothetical protein